MERLPTRCSSEVRHDRVARADSACVERLKAAGAVIVGKTHTHEFAYGIMTPTTANPWTPERIPGGSSGGSGASVAARGCFMGLGSDTGGSIRIPASFCGVTGLKPTHGAVSLRGAMPLAPSLDTAGPLAVSAADCALVHRVISGFDPAYLWSRPGLQRDTESIAGVRVSGPTWSSDQQSEATPARLTRP